MKNFLKVAAGFGFAVSLALSVDASATVVTSLDGTKLTMSGVNYEGQGPQTLAPGIIWSSTFSYSLFGYTYPYGLAGNGAWGGSSDPFVGSNSSTDTMTFKFDNPVTGFGGFFNYAPNYGTPVIAAYDASGKLLESFTLNLSTPSASNGGQFYGFLDQTADISSFTMTGAYMVGKDFVVQNSAKVPEPASLSLLGLGLMGVAAARRKSTKR